MIHQWHAPDKIKISGPISRRVAIQRGSSLPPLTTCQAFFWLLRYTS